MKDMIFALHDKCPKYKQIYEKLKTFIEQGDVQANEQLPSIRKLAESLGVSRNTTLTAYEQLVAEGYIRGEGRRGYFVNLLEPLLLNNPETKMKREVSQASPEILVDFRAGAVDPTHFPVKTWRKMTNQILTMPASYTYGDPFGEKVLRLEIAKYLFQSRGLETNSDAVIIGSNTQQMLLNIGHILKEKYHSIIVENPGYDGAREVFDLHKFQLETLPIQKNGADFSKLDQFQSKLIYVTPSHQCPLGVTMPIQQRQALIQWANNRDGYIIEDDYDSEFRYAQKPFPALSSIDATRVIYIGNFSKAFLPGLRMCYMVLPEPVLTEYKKTFGMFQHTASKLHQLTMAKLMEEGEWLRHIKRMRLVYQRKMQLMVSELRKAFQDKITIIGEQSGLYVLIQAHLGKSESSLIKQAQKQGVRIYSTFPHFIADYPSDPLLKLGFSNLTPTEIVKGVSLLKEAWT